MRNAFLLTIAIITATRAGAMSQPIRCAGGVAVNPTTQSPAQGELMLVEITSRSPLNGLKAGWAGQKLHFWQEGEVSNTYRAFLGVDLRKKPSPYPIAISATLENGDLLTCTVSLSVKKGNFLVERLQVDDKYVELSQTDLARAKVESRRLAAIFGSVTPERLWQGSFRLPLKGFKASGNFGKRRILNGRPRSPHSGEDFSAPAGTVIRAPQRGRVVLAEEHFFTGNTVVVDHGLGLYTFYGHMESISVEVGERVETEALLGRVGATGRVTGAHLHWTVRLNKVRVNPSDLVELFSQ